VLQVIDDAVPEYLQEFYEMAALGLSNKKRIKPLVDFHVKYEKTAGSETGNIPISFVHILKSSHEASPMYSNFYQLVDIVCKGARLQLKEVHTGRIYISTPQKTDKTHYQPHVDLNIDHLVVLYYVNDSDGDTVFFDNDGKIVKTVSPTRGRIVFFDGSILHAAGIPKNTHRCVVNFDIEVTK